VGCAKFVGNYNLLQIDMEFIGSGATAFVWIAVFLISAVIGLSTTDILKLKDKEDDHS